MAWKPGQSGNPLGRTRRQVASFEHVQKCLRKLGGRYGEVWAEELHLIAMNRTIDGNVRLKAFSILLPYLWGRAPEQVFVTGQVAGQVRVIHEYHDPVSGAVIDQASRVDGLQLLAGEIDPTFAPPLSPPTDDPESR